jgi:hypothetical protein
MPRAGAAIFRAAAWSPADLPGLAAAPVVALMRAAGKMWQDAARTTPATANGQSVYVFDCTFTGLRYTASSSSARAVLTDEGGGGWSLTFDGADDRYYAALDWSGQPFTHVTGWDVGNPNVSKTLWSGGGHADLGLAVSGVDRVATFKVGAALYSWFTPELFTGNTPRAMLYRGAAQTGGAGTIYGSLDGGAESSASGTGLTQASGAYLGAAATGDYTPGRWGGLIHCTADLSAEDRAMAVAYLTPYLPAA